MYAERQYPPLNLGDPESGYLTETNLLSISLRISKDWRNIGINLGISYKELDRIQFKHRCAFRGVPKRHEGFVTHASVAAGS